MVNLHSSNIHRHLQELSVKINFVYKIRLKSCTNEYLKLKTNPDQNFYYSDTALTLLFSATAGRVRAVYCKATVDNLMNNRLLQLYDSENIFVR